MLLKNKINDYKKFIAIGQLSLALGILGNRISQTCLLENLLKIDLDKFPSANFWNGFIMGLSMVLLGISIVFNIRGIKGYRATKNQPHN